MNAQEYLEKKWKTGNLSHSQMIAFLEEYATIQLEETFNKLGIVLKMKIKNKIDLHEKNNTTPLR